MFTRAVLWCSGALGLALGWLAWNGDLPGQTFGVEKAGEIEFPQFHTFSDKTLGVVIPVKLGKKSFEKGVPAKLNMEVSISAELRKTWALEPKVEAYLDKNGKIQKVEPQPAVDSDEDESGTIKAILDHLAKDGRYLFKVYLHGKQATQPQPGDVARAIELIGIDPNSKAIRVVFWSKD